MLHHREPGHFRRQRDSERVVAAPEVFVREALGSRPQRLCRIEKQVHFGEPEAGARLIAADGDGKLGGREEAVVVLDAGADDTLDGDLGETKVAGKGEGATTLISLEGEYGEMNHI